jgi:hypothetical protein
MAMTRRGLMIHGGYNAQGAIDETWVRPPLASTFTLLPQGGGPVNSVAVADQDAAQVFAVTLAPPSPEALGLWRFDGQHWFEISRAPYHANSATAAIDPATHRLFVFDGGNLYFQFNGMWVYSSTFPVERIGTPCASVGAPAPQLQVEAPAIGAAMQLVITCTTPFDLGLLVLGFDDQSWNGVPLPLDLGSLGLPGCLARVAPILSRLLPGGSGTVTFLPIAADPALIGSVLFVQAATVTGGALRGVTDTARCTVY